MIVKGSLRNQTAYFYMLSNVEWIYHFPVSITSIYFLYLKIRMKKYNTNRHMYICS